MKRYLFTCFFVFLFIYSSFGQKKESNFQQIETAKIAYISKELQLTTKEAQLFFPMYNEYRKEMRALRHASRNKGSHFKYKQVNELELDSTVLACKKKYQKKFSTVIPTSKALRFFEVEREFREKLFKELEIRNRRKH